MCEIIRKYKGKTFTGYKVVLEVKDKIYSPATGIEYQVGQVPVPETRGTYHSKYFTNMIDVNSFAHNKKYRGLTAVYVDLVSAENLGWRIHKWVIENDYEQYILGNSMIKVKIVQMKLSGRLFHGIYNSNDIILGSRIDEITNK